MLSTPKNLRFRTDLANLTLPEDLRREIVVRALPPGAALCRRSAARFYGIDLLLPHERALDFPLEIAVPVGTEPVAREGVVAHECDLLNDVVMLDGIPVTDMDRTLLDLARFAPRPLALAILDRADAAEVLDRPKLLRRLTSLKRQRYVGVARELINLADAGAESPYESFCRLRIVDAGFDPPETQIRIPRPGGLAPYRLDMGWRKKRRAVEYDGVADHESAEQRRHDELRRRYIRSLGWEVVVVGKGEVLGTAPGVELAVAELLGQAWNQRPRQW